MPIYPYALKPDGPKELELDVSLTEVIVRFKGKELSRVGADRLKDGFDVTLPDGTKVVVRRTTFPPAIAVTKDGVALVGGGADPEAVLEQVWKQTAGWGVMFAIWGGYTLARADSSSVGLAAYLPFAIAAVLGVLAALTRKRWFPAIAITAAVFTGYVAYWAANGGSLCVAVGFLMFPLWHLWAWRLISRSAPRAGASSAP